MAVAMPRPQTIATWKIPTWAPVRTAAHTLPQPKKTRRKVPKNSPMAHAGSPRWALPEFVKGQSAPPALLLRGTFLRSPGRAAAQADGLGRRRGDRVAAKSGSRPEQRATSFPFPFRGCRPDRGGRRGNGWGD